MLKLEIKFHDAPEAVDAALDKFFARYPFRKEILPDGTICYSGTGQARDYGAFGRAITTLKDQAWFMSGLVKWLWYNSYDGETETDFTVEDILYHYTRRKSTMA